MGKAAKKDGIRVITDPKEVCEILARPGMIEELSRQMKAAEKAKKKRGGSSR